MSEDMIRIVANELNKQPKIINDVIELIEDGNTVPFIARYRKEATGGLDEVEIKDIQDKWAYNVQLKERKEEVIRLIQEQDKLTPELEADIQAADKLQRVEDLYRPYKQKRRTRATIAKEKGLEPLAEIVWKQEDVEDLQAKAAAYISEEQKLLTEEDVFQGINDIIAEWIADDATFREYIRRETWKEGILVTTVKNREKDEKEIFKMYYEYEERIKGLVSHRVLAINRGEKEDILRASVQAPEDKLLQFLEKRIVKTDVAFCRDVLTSAIQDSYKRLIAPSVEREVRNRLTEEAEAQAIDVFSENLRNLLLQPPLKGRTILGVDPAFRTGCKLVVIDETGKMHAIDVIYPTAPRKDTKGAEKKVLQFIQEFDVGLVAIGNGTASRETEQFIADVIENNKLDLPYIIVNEAGASVYSASALAREEFPKLEVEERSAVSIARRVQDPLAELVKIDPKSIGIGQYQHDVSQKELTGSLGFVVETAVNQVGVNVNTASSSLLQYVAGLSKTTANNIIKERENLGKFDKRIQLKKVPRLGPKTYEQSIGFLRIIDGKHSLDQTPIHPESYQVTEKLLETMGAALTEVGSSELEGKLNDIDVRHMAAELEIGEPTLEDIIAALKKPGRDMREDFPQPILKQKVLSVEDLEQGMEMQGTVRNVVDFGAFIDIGVGQDGLVHISKLANRFVKHPMDVVAVGDVVTVWVDEVDEKRGRIALTMVKGEK